MKLVKIKLKEVSLVDRPASRKKFSFIKEEDNDPTPEEQAEFLRLYAEGVQVIMDLLN